MRKSLLAVAVTVVGVLGMSATAQAQEELPPCPPGTSNPGYCEAGPSKATKRSVRSAFRQARKKLRKRGVLVHLLRKKRIRFAAMARTKGRYRMRLIVRSCGERVLVARGFRRVTGSGQVILGLRVTKAGRAYLLRKTYLLGLRPGARRQRARNVCERRSGNRRQRYPRMLLVVRFVPAEGPGVTLRKRTLVR